MKNYKCPNPKNNPNCNITKQGKYTKTCRSCSKFKGRTFICKNCGKIVLYKPGYSKDYCSRLCYREHTLEERKLSTNRVLNSKKSRKKAITTRKNWTKLKAEEYSEKMRKIYWTSTYSQKYLEKKSDTISKKIVEGKFVPHGNHKKGIYFSKNGKNEIFHSLWELARMIELDEKDTRWTKDHKIRIKYFYKGVNRNYIPDFLIEGKILEEIKPGKLLGYNGNMDKIEAAKTWCKSKGLKFVLKSKINEKYLSKAKNYYEKNLQVNKHN